jgi:hypothetical protein
LICGDLKIFSIFFKIALDNIWRCGILSPVKKYASALPGRFAFWGRTARPSVALKKNTKDNTSRRKRRHYKDFAALYCVGAHVCLKGAEMPSYQNLVPPTSLMPGDVGFSFNNEAFPGSAQAGSQFAIPSYAGQPDVGTAVRWQTLFGTAPTAVSLVLQGAMADVDAEYQTIDTSAATAGEARTVANVQAKFLRIKFVSSTGGSGLTAKLLV